MPTNKILTITNTTHLSGSATSISITGDPYRALVPANSSVSQDLILVQFDEEFLDDLANKVDTGNVSVSLDSVLLSSSEVSNLKYGGSGSTSAGANLGSGSEIYKDTVAGVLNFRGAVAGSTKMSIATNATDLLLDIDETKIVHQNISGAGTNDHTAIDSHITDVAIHRSINDAGTSATDLWSASKIDSEITASSSFVNPRIVFKQQFTGTGAQTVFNLTSSILNGTFTTGSWSVANVLNTFPGDVTKTTNKVLYDSANVFTRNRIAVSSISALGAVTLSTAPILGENFYIWYWYEVQTNDVIDDYYREDFIASMEAANSVIAVEVPANTSSFSGILSAADTTVQAALDTLDDISHTDLPDIGTYTHPEIDTHIDLNNSIESDINYYVDGTTGDDANDGLAWGTAKKTFDFLYGSGVGAIPRVINAIVKVYCRGIIRGATATRHTVLNDFKGSGSLQIIGTMTSLETFTITGYDDNLTHIEGRMYLDASGASWTIDEHQGHFQKTSLSSTYRPIANNTATQLRINNAPTSPGATSDIYSATVFSPQDQAAPGVDIAYSSGNYFLITRCTLPIYIQNMDFRHTSYVFPVVVLSDYVVFTSSNMRKIFIQYSNFVQLSTCFLEMYDWTDWIDIYLSKLYLFDTTIDGGGWAYGVYLSQNSSAVINGGYFLNHAEAISGEGTNKYSIHNCYFEDNDYAILQNNETLVLNAWSTGTASSVLRFKNNNIAMCLSGEVLSSIDADIVHSGNTVEIKLGENHTETFANLNAHKAIYNAASGAAVSYQSGLTYLPLVPDEFDPTVSSLTSYTLQDAIDEVYAASTLKTIFNANTILKADTDNTPTALTVNEQTLVGRITAGVITGLTATQVRTLINVADGATANLGDVVKVGTPVDNQVGVWTGDGTIEGTTGFTYDGANLQITGDIGSTGTPITKGWYSGLHVINSINEFSTDGTFADNSDTALPTEKAVKTYVDNNIWVLPPIIEWWDPTGGLPVAPTIGDRYGSDGTANGWTDGYIYEWDGVSWVESDVPEEGWMVWDLLGLLFWVFFSGGWMEEGSGTYLPLAGGTMTGDILGSVSLGSTGTRITKLWATDIECTNTITGSVTGNAGTVTNATFTTALTIDTGTVRIIGDVSNTSVLTLGAGASAIDQDVTTTASPTFVALQSIDYIDFDLTATPAAAEGRVCWNSDVGTLNIGMPGGNVNLQIGQEGLVRVRNVSGSTISNGKAVYATGATGNKLTIDLADNTDSDKITLLGVATEDIAHNSNGYVALWGIVRGDALQPINTSSFSEGDKLYLSTAGNLVNVHPSTPTSAVVLVGIVKRVHASVGEINVAISYFTNGNDFDGTMRQGLINKSTGTSAAAGFTAVNDQNHWMTIGIGGSNNSVFGEAAIFYGPGYADNLYAVDGNKSHKWYNDPTDSHNNSSLSYLNMELDAAGNLTIPRGQIISSLAIGTAPLAVTSTTLNTNLNADLLDGQHASDFLNRTEWLQNGFENRTDSTITFTDGTLTFSIQPVVTSFDYWVEGVKYTSTGDTKVISNTEGIHVIYYDGATLSSLASPTDGQVSELIRTKCLVSFIYWDVSAAEAIYIGEERHGQIMSPSSHAYHHFIDGLQYVNGIGLNTLSVDGTGITVDAQFGVDAGAVSDEDLYLTTGAVTSTTGLPVYYMTGSAANWSKHTETGFSVRTSGGTSATRLAYNEYTGGAWQLTEVPNNDFVLYHIFATTEKDNPIISIMGQEVYGNRSQARAGALVEILSLVTNDILFPEIRPIATVIYQTNLGYANTVNAKVVSTDEGDDYIDWRSETISRTSVSTSDHGALTGLGDDDHILYTLAPSPAASTNLAIATWNGTSGRQLQDNSTVFITATGQLSTGGETSPDVDPGGICLNHGAGTDSVLTTKSSDIAHPFTSLAQADTYLEIRKHVQVSGGALIRGFTEATTAFEYRGYASTASTGTYATIQLTSYLTDGGTGVTALSDNSNIVGFRNNAVMKHQFRGGGDAEFVGALTLGSRVGTSEPAGTIQWTGTYFQGYNGASYDNFGDTFGAASSTDNAIVRFDSTTGKVLQASTIIIDDTDHVTAVETLGYNSANAIGDSGAAFNLTLSDGQHQTVTLTADCAMTIVDTGSIGDGQWTLTVTQGGTGSYSITSSTVSGGTVKVEGGAAPTFSSGVGDVDTMVIKKEGTVYYLQVAASDWQTWT